jgi:hypothetical protein
MGARSQVPTMIDGIEEAASPSIATLMSLNPTQHQDVKHVTIRQF